MASINSLSFLNNNSSLYTSLLGSKSTTGAYGANSLSQLLGYGQNNAATSEKTQSYLTGIKAASNTLKQAADKLLTNVPPIFKAMTAASSNEDALAITSKSYTKYTAASKTSKMNLSIEQVADKQVNTGETLDNGRITSAQKGFNTFSLTIGGKSMNLSVTISAADNNQDAMKKVASAINNKNAGVTASIVTDAKTKKSSLVLESTLTGEKNAFSIHDVDGRGSVISALGVDTVDKEAKDALYTVDGVQKRSSSNNITLDNDTKGTIQKTAESISISEKRNVSGISNAVQDMIGGYNKLLETAKSNNNDRGAKSIENQLSNVWRSNSVTLKNIGIEQDKNGYLTIDEKKLSTAIDDGSAEKALKGSGSYTSTGFIQKVGQIANDVDRNANMYVSSNRQNAAGSSYNQYMASKMTGLGMLFDSMF